MTGQIQTGDRALIVFVGYNDWANVCNGWTRAINAHSSRFRARAVIGRAHRLGYAQDITLAVDWPARADEVRAVFDSASILVHSGDGDYRSFEHFRRHGLRTEGRRLMTWHAGSAYRSAPAAMDERDARLGFERRFFSPSLYGLAVANDPHATPLMPVVASGRRPRRDDPTVVCHSPSNRATKGTAIIESVVTELPDVRAARVEWRMLEGLAHAECVRKKAGATVFIDHLAPEAGGFGAAALEAMAQGAACLSATTALSCKIDRWWPRPPIVCVPDRTALLRELHVLLDDPVALHERRVASWIWVRDVASPARVAARFDEWIR